jgi:hypothetical protein
MNAIIRKNLTDALAVDANEVDTASDTSGAFGDGRDRARFCRTIATCIWGVSDSLPTGPGTGSGGWQRGSPHAPDACAIASDSCADCDTGGKQRRSIDSGEVADRKEHHHFTR